MIVPPGGTPAFLAPWPVATLDRPELADLLVRLGIRTLGGFAALPGPPGARPVRSRRCPLPPGGPGDRGRAARLPPVLPPTSVRRTGARSGGDDAARPGVLGEPEFWGGERRRCPGRPGPGRCPGPARSRGRGHGAGSRAAGARPSGPGSSPGPAGQGGGSGADRHRTAPASPARDRRGRARSPHRRPPWSLSPPLPAQLVDADGQPWVSPAGGMATAVPDPAVGGREDRGSRSPGGPGPGRPTSGGGRSGAGGARPACRSSPAGTAHLLTRRAGRLVAGSDLRLTGRRHHDRPYAELHCHSNFSFLDGASHPEELVAEAARLGPRRPRPHRPRRPVRGGPLRRGGPGLRAGRRSSAPSSPWWTADGRGGAPAPPTRPAPTWWSWPATPRATPG